jgi:hypothetical protein
VVVVVVVVGAVVVAAGTDKNASEASSSRSRRGKRISNKGARRGVTRGKIKKSECEKWREEAKQSAGGQVLMVEGWEEVSNTRFMLVLFRCGHAVTRFMLVL